MSTLRRPPCALCGQPLPRLNGRMEGKRHYVLQFRLSGQPMAAWHEGCVRHDPVLEAFNADGRARATVSAILERGHDRIAAHEPFWAQERERQAQSSEREGKAAE